MYSRVKLSRSRDGYVWHTRGKQSDLVANSINFIVDKSESPARENPDDVALVFSGISLAGLVSIRSALPGYGERGDVHVSVKDVHAIYSSLLSCLNWMTSEEEFWMRVGFFREHAKNLARGFLVAMMEYDSLDS